MVNEKYELREFIGEELPIEVGSLEREALSYLGNRMRIHMEEQPFGFYYRFAVKEHVPNSEGDPATLFLHFVTPFVKADNVVPANMEASIEAKVSEVTRKTTLLFSMITGNAIGAVLPAPDYMIKELKEQWGA